MRETLSKPDSRYMGGVVWEAQRHPTKETANKAQPRVGHISKVALNVYVINFTTLRNVYYVYTCGKKVGGDNRCLPPFM